MRCGVFLALAILFQTANCLPKYSSLVSNGYSSDYKSDPKCKYVDDIEYDEKCEPYTGEFKLLKFSLNPITVARLAWVPWVPGNPSFFEQWVPEPINL